MPWHVATGRFLSSIDSVSGLRDRNADFEAMRKIVRATETDNGAYFRNADTDEGGLDWQQTRMR